jgi:hypothetical protein
MNRAIWLYFREGLETEAIIPILKDWYIDTVFFSVGGGALADGTARTRHFVDYAHSQNIEVHAMCLEDKSFALNHERACERVGEVVRFGGFDGIHLDTEFWLIDGWRENGVAERFVQLLQKIRQVKASLPLSAAITWHVDVSQINRELDFLVTMAYFDKPVPPRRIVERYARVDTSIPTFAGFNLKELNNLNEAAETVNQLDATYGGQDNYRGACLFDYRRFVGMI